jgi:hypothetical protein
MFTSLQFPQFADGLPQYALLTVRDVRGVRTLVAELHRSPHHCITGGLSLFIHAQQVIMRH